MAPLTAQGIGLHREYKGYAACVAEIDCTPQTVNRVVEDGYTGPRVTKVTYAVDVGLPINPLGLEAQMIGGIMDGIAQALTYSLHLDRGHLFRHHRQHPTSQLVLPSVATPPPGRLA